MVRIIKEYGFCDGVKNALSELNIASSNKKVILLHPLMHNEKVMKEILNRNKNLSMDTSKVGKDDVIVTSAHGYTAEEIKKYQKNPIFTTTCKVVEQRYKLMANVDIQNSNCIYLGTKVHQEVKAFLSFFPFFKLADETNYKEYLSKEKENYILTQSTFDYIAYNNIKDFLSSSDYKYKLIPICPIYTKRIENTLKEVKDKENSFVFVIGSLTSANCNSIKNALTSNNIKALIVNSIEDLKSFEFKYKDYYLVSSTSIDEDTVLDIENYVKSNCPL